jgi:hypothetical protein
MKTRRSLVAVTVVLAAASITACGSSNSNAQQPAGGSGGQDGGSDVGTGDAAVDCTGPFTLEHQQPVECHPFPKSLWYKPLPANVMDHLAPDSDQIVEATFTMDGTLSYPWKRDKAITTLGTVTSDGFDLNSPLYYGQASDPVYTFESCASSTNAKGSKFHAPSQAACKFVGGDSSLGVWDQTNGMLFGFYTFVPKVWQKLPACPGNGHTGTDEDPCPLSYSSCSQYDWWNYEGFGPGGGLGGGGVALRTRGVEVLSGRIPHGLYLVTRCTAGKVFPSYGYTLACADADAGTSHRPPNGSLVLLDYTATQLADIKSKVPLWQYLLLEAMTVYGGYIGDTSGDLDNKNGAGGIVPAATFEGPAAYNMFNLPYPIGDWLMSFPHSDVSQEQPLYCFSRGAGQQCNMGVYTSVPLETGPNCPAEPCDISKHLHIADACVAKGLAGQPGGCI